MVLIDKMNKRALCEQNEDTAWKELEKGRREREGKRSGVKGAKREGKQIGERRKRKASPDGNIENDDQHKSKGRKNTV